MVGWIKMPLGKVVGLGPGHIVLDGEPAHHSSPSPLSAHAYCGQMVAHLSNCWALVVFVWAYHFASKYNIHWFIKKCGSTFVITTLENSFDFYNLCTTVSRRNILHTLKTCSIHLTRYLVKMKHHISCFYNPLLKYYHVPTASSVVWNIKFMYRENKLKIIRYVQNVHHWREHKRVGHCSTAPSISDCSKPRHTHSTRCRSSSMSWTWQWRHIDVTYKINK